VRVITEPPLIIDGHVHITNRVYWEGLDPWRPQPFGFDYARAKAAGVKVIIENIGTYGYANFNYAPKQVLRLIEAFHRTAEEHQDVMGVALSAADARRLVAEGRMAVFLGVEAGFDHEGDPDVLRALYRLGLRVVQFSTQTCYNAFADAEVGGPAAWNGINDRGRALVAVMNELGILIDVTHATAAAQAQIIAASQAPVVASHVGLSAVSGGPGPGTGMLSDQILEALAATGGMVGIIGAGSRISPRYRDWMAGHPEDAARDTAAAAGLASFVSPMQRAALDHGEFGAWLDESMRARHLAAFARLPGERDDHSPDTRPYPAAEEWAAHVAHVIDVAGPDHVGIGLDLVAAHHPSVIANASGYPDLITALRRVTSEENVRKIAGENWLRVLAALD
jgi:membrane dipeptidase